jgi:hypothetical protein
MDPSVSAGILRATDRPESGTHDTEDTMATKTAVKPIPKTGKTVAWVKPTRG